MINPIYLKEETVRKLQSHYYQDPAFRSVTMAQFFTEKAMETILNEVMAAEFTDDQIATMYRRQISQTPKSIDTLIQSEEFINLLRQICGRQVEIIATRMYRYGHRDYKIISDDQESASYDIIIDLTPDWDDELGGFVAYTDGEGNFYRLGTTFGSVTLVESRDHHDYVKYVNHYANELKRYFIIINAK